MSMPKQIRVLIAEDDASVRAALAALIEDEPQLTLVAAVADAEHAIAAAQRERPDVALLDVRMPGGGGAHAARGIKRASPQTRVVALSAFEDRSTVLEMLEAGVDGYLVKGSTIGAIVKSIERADEGESSLSTEVTGAVIGELATQLSTERRASERYRRLERRIARALEPESLRLVFQPICTLDGTMVGTEALSRFRGPPERGPLEWFAEATSVGLRTDLELAAVRAAFDELPTLPSGSCLSVNVSPETLASASFEELVRAVDGTRIVAEVTEHAPVADYARLNDVIALLRSHGLRLAIDDAGAGFASLRHILQLDPDFIKLDRTLIEGVGNDRSKQALAKGLISFAQTIGATIIAEGIETPAELSMLRELGVRYGQGFYLGRPVPLAELASMPGDGGTRSAAAPGT
jgi:EAL domain-containing protein (putative c-di-GMP-specific phosphodiesterase class I)/DNA-binding NarL/FixJ family response regulator